MASKYKKYMTGVNNTAQHNTVKVYKITDKAQFSPYYTADHCEYPNIDIPKRLKQIGCYGNTLCNPLKLFTYRGCVLTDDYSIRDWVCENDRENEVCDMQIPRRESFSPTFFRADRFFYINAGMFNRIKSQLKYDIQNMEDLMRMEIYERGPISIGYELYPSFFKFFGDRAKSTAIYSSKDRQPDEKTHGGHAANIIGWGEEQGVKYWLVKNSWGNNWGDSGYFKIERGVDLCGIEIEIAAVIVDRANVLENYLPETPNHIGQARCELGKYIDYIKMICLAAFLAFIVSYIQNRSS
jgi:hypothetical protein